MLSRGAFLARRGLAPGPLRRRTTSPPAGSGTLARTRHSAVAGRATSSSSPSTSSATTRSASPAIRPRARRSIDALARGGVRYRRAHVQNVVCMPSRATMLTGQHPLTHGVVVQRHPARRRRAERRATAARRRLSHRADRQGALRSASRSAAALSARTGSPRERDRVRGAASITSSSRRTARSAAITTRRGSTSITPRTSPASAPCSPAPAAARPARPR